MNLRVVRIWVNSFDLRIRSRYSKSFYGATSALCLLIGSSLFLIVAARDSAFGAGPALKDLTGPLKVALFLSSDATRCYESDLTKAIKQLTSAEARRINRGGGLGGAPIRIVVHDHLGDEKKAADHVKMALDDPLTLAMIGITNSSVGKSVFDQIGPQILSSGIPFITYMSMDPPYPNVFSMSIATSDETERLRDFVTEGGPDGEAFNRPAFVGIEGDTYSESIGDALLRLPPERRTVADHRVHPGADGSLADAAVAMVAADLEAKAVDIVVLAAGSRLGARIVEKLDERGVNPTYFVATGEISELLGNAKALKSVPRMYAFLWDDVPNTINERMRRRVAATPDTNWGRIRRAVPLAPDTNPNWINGLCKRRPAAQRAGFDLRLVRALSGGAEWRDIFKLVADIAEERAAHGEPTLSELRKGIVKGLLSYESKKKAYRGWAYDYSFTKKRAIEDDPYIVTSSTSQKGVVLASTQIVRIGERLKRHPVIQLSLDPISISNIDSNNRTFDAEFYLSFKSPVDGIGIDSIEFSNAFRSPLGTGNHLTKKRLHAGVAGTDFPIDVQVYRISGKFTFDPRLGRYPFDTQSLSISFRPSQTQRPFLIQPPEDALKSSPEFIVDGWTAREQFVGTDQEIIPSIDPAAGEKRFVPFYAFTYTWLVERNSTDYRLRVIAPLGFILLVTYFSVLLGKARFDATVAIQVTALLSSIALYLSLPKVDSDQATLSDKSFLLTYALVAIMIGLTVVKDMRPVDERRSLRKFVGFLQLALFPLVAIGMLTYLLNFTVVSEALRDLVAPL